VEERQLILNREVDPDRQKTLLTTAILIAAQAKLFDADFVWELFKEDQMDFNNPVIAKLFDKHYGQKLAQATENLQQKLVASAQVVAQAEAARHEAEAAQHEAEAAQHEAVAAQHAAEAARQKAEAEAAHQWQKLMLKVLEHRFQSIPVALALLLQEVTPAQRNQVSDLILDATDVDHCLQGLQQMQVGTTRFTTTTVQ
jgi:Fe2+ transport system protein B